VIGLFIYLFCILTVLRNGFKYYRTDRFIRASVNLLLVIFIQGMFEVTVFKIGMDFLIWSISGFMIARVIVLTRKNKEQLMITTQ